ncbi:hypothetical protein [Pseudomonas umsongensis]|uniref:hypothetical protein n=1 Tax=Pseudomonas umsongensis TaxID=198618 RepID=UPI002009F786|nr:hypothetical protein [Pseudomonas umsongensis]MCK8684950.1 hypothetical protein [Pseudomonas umsongensis]
MLLKNKSLVAVMSCALMLAAAPLLPVDLSIMNAAYAKEGGGGGGGGHGGGNGGGNGGGHGGGNGGGNGAGHSGSGHAGSNGHGEGLSSDHAGKAVRDHGVSGNHYGSDRNSDNGHGTTTSGIAHSKDTRGLDKARAISESTPGDHNSKGLSKAGAPKKSH